jgi:hypothetical protein
MTQEIIKGALAVVILAGAITSVIMGNEAAAKFLVPLAIFAFGYYFKTAETPVVNRIKAARAPK